MHPNNRKWLDDLRSQYPHSFCGAKVLEMGSFTVRNKTIRPWFKDCEYIGIDTTVGRGVDMVVDAKDFIWKDEYFDTIMCFSMLEHNPEWRLSMLNCLKYLKKNGMLFMCWGAEGNVPHMDVWLPVPHQEVPGFLADNGIQIIDAFFEEDRYGKDCGGAYDLIGIKKDSIVMQEKIEIEWLGNPRQARLSIGGICSCLCTIYNNGKAKVMIIDSVLTKEEHRGRGYGTMLLNEALKLAKEENIDSVELIVNQDNAAAKKLYEKIGFKKINKDYYRIILNIWPT